MTDRKARKVLIINNIKSDTIDQAIFILKGDPGVNKSVSFDTNAAAEAQEIIDRYIRQVERLKGATKNSVKTKKAGKKFPWPLLFFAVSASSIALSIALLCHAL